MTKCQQCGGYAKEYFGCPCGEYKATKLYGFKGSLQEEVLIDLVSAIDGKWTDRKSVPPKELLDPLISAKEVLGDRYQRR